MASTAPFGDYEVVEVPYAANNDARKWDPRVVWTTRPIAFPVFVLDALLLLVIAKARARRKSMLEDEFDLLEGDHVPTIFMESLSKVLGRAKMPNAAFNC